MDTLKHLAARTGFELFVASAERMSRDDINYQLALRRLPEVSDRTFRHYRRMANRGQRTYLPINEYDMAVKSQRESAAS